MQRVLRYGLRPPLSLKRLSWTAAGKVRLKLRKPSATGRTSIVLQPVEFLRVVAMAPAAQRALKPDAKRIIDVAELTLATHQPDSITPHAHRDASVPRPYRRRWAELLEHIFDHDVLVCDRCWGRMVPVQTVQSPAVIQRILTHLGLPATLPQPASARAPPQQTSWEFDPDSDDAFDQSG